jgi:hypothetical protein
MKSTSFFKIIILISLIQSSAFIPTFGAESGATARWTPAPELASNVMQTGFHKRVGEWIKQKFANSCNNTNSQQLSSMDVLGYHLGDYCLMPPEDRKLIADTALKMVAESTDSELFETLNEGNFVFTASKIISETESVSFDLTATLFDDKIYLDKLERTIQDRPGNISLQPSSTFANALIKKYGTPVSALTDRQANLMLMQQAKQTNQQASQNAITNKEAVNAAKTGRDLKVWENVLNTESKANIVQYIWLTKDSWSDQTALIIARHRSELTSTLVAADTSATVSFIGRHTKNARDKMEKKRVEFKNSLQLPSL